MMCQQWSAASLARPTGVATPKPLSDKLLIVSTLLEALGISQRVT